MDGNLRLQITRLNNRPVLVLKSGKSQFLLGFKLVVHKAKT